MLALGDSITAGFGLKGDVAEYRGESFSAGGDPGALTLPNLLRSLGGNVNVTGFSLGVRAGIHTADGGCEGPDVAVCQLNAAVDGASMLRVLPQVEYLAKMLGHCTRCSAPFKNHADDWKLVTLFAGVADAVFASATGGGGPTPLADFETSFERVLHAIRTQLGGRVFLNVLALPRHLSLVEPIVRAHVGCEICYVMSRVSVRWTDVELWDRAVDGYNEVMQSVIRKRYPFGDPSFVVAFRPFLRDLLLTGDMVEHLDCLHPNSLLARNMSVALWNSMISREATTAIDFKAAPLCPNEDTRLR